MIEPLHDYHLRKELAHILTVAAAVNDEIHPNSTLVDDVIRLFQVDERIKKLEARLAMLERVI